MDQSIGGPAIGFPLQIIYFLLLHRALRFVELSFLCFNACKRVHIAINNPVDISWEIDSNEAGRHRARRRKKLLLKTMHWQ